MITDKDRESARGLVDEIDDLVFSGYEGHNMNKYTAVESVLEYTARIHAESADQARKEAAERVVCAWREHGEGITLRILRDAILGDSVVKENLITDHIPDAVEKLAIAVKALEYVVSKSLPSSAFERHYSRLQDACAKASDALKEIQ